MLFLFCFVLFCFLFLFLLLFSLLEFIYIGASLHETNVEELVHCS